MRLHYSVYNQTKSLVLSEIIYSVYKKAFPGKNTSRSSKMDGLTIVSKRGPSSFIASIIIVLAFFTLQCSSAPIVLAC